MIDKITNVLVNSDVEIMILPDGGIAFEIAKRYRKRSNKNIYRTALELNKS